MLTKGDNEFYHDERDTRIEAEVLQAQEPVAIVGELCPQTRSEVLAKGHAVGAYLYTATQPPAPCPKCAELAADNQAVRSLMDCYNLGGWTDSLTLLKERDALQAKVAELTSNEFDWAKANAKCTDIIKEQAERIAEQSALIEKCEKAISVAARSRIAILRNSDPSNEWYPYRTDDEVAKIDGYTSSLIEALAHIVAHKS